MKSEGHEIRGSGLAFCLKYLAKSPYLENDRRLGDVIAAIQLLGTYQWANRDVGSWAKQLDTPDTSGEAAWTAVFREHPEFFRINDLNKASLRWRHAYDRTYNTKTRQKITIEEFEQLNENEQEIYSRHPLTAEQIQSLMATAVELHGRAIAHSQERRWLTLALFTLLGVVLGAVLGG